MKIGQILRELQPEEYKKFNKKRRRRGKQEHLSFDDYDRMMRKNKGIDSARCGGR